VEWLQARRLMSALFSPAIATATVEHVNERAAKIGLAAVVCGVLAFTGYALVLTIDAFEPCRVLYRIPPAVRDSLACRIHSAITLASLLFVVATAVSLAAAGVLAYWRRAGTRNHQGT
jgi:hypothetical protein